MNNRTFFLLSSFLVFSPLIIHSTPQNVKDWTETFNCNGGLVITHKPEGISWHVPKETQSIRPFKETLDLWMNPATHTPLKAPLKLDHNKLNRDDFYSALLKAGLLEAITSDSSAGSASGSIPSQQ